MLLYSLLAVESIKGILRNYLNGKLYIFFNSNNPEIHHKLFLSVVTCIIGHYNASVRIINLVSHTTYVVCVKADSERQIFEKLFHGMVGLFYSLSFCQKSAEKKSPKKFLFFIFRFGA